MFKPYTPAIRMQRTALYRKSQGWFAALAETYNVTVDDLYLAWLDFASLSLRLNGNNPGVDFEWLTTSDSSETIQQKFIAYLNTETANAVWQLERDIQAFDAPVDPDTAPEPPSDPEA